MLLLDLNFNVQVYNCDFVSSNNMLEEEFMVKYNLKDCQIKSQFVKQNDRSTKLKR